MARPRLGRQRADPAGETRARRARLRHARQRQAPTRERPNLRSRGRHRPGRRGRSTVLAAVLPGVQTPRGCRLWDGGRRPRGPTQGTADRRGEGEALVEAPANRPLSPRARAAQGSQGGVVLRAQRRRERGVGGGAVAGCLALAGHDGRGGALRGEGGVAALAGVQGRRRRRRIGSGSGRYRRRRRGGSPPRRRRAERGRRRGAAHAHRPPARVRRGQEQPRGVQRD
mmetsp:Transcript_3702/g.14950  ORF Transcript_3702/g.14950 Transcript_3702/m.14950 type:complete len:227 (+) Transcript_3702:322-1002(+)